MRSQSQGKPRPQRLTIGRIESEMLWDNSTGRRTILTPIGKQILSVYLAKLSFKDSVPSSKSWVRVCILAYVLEWDRLPRKGSYQLDYIFEQCS